MAPEAVCRLGKWCRGLGSWLPATKTIRDRMPVAPTGAFPGWKVSPATGCFFASSMQLPHQQVAPQRLQQEAATSKERVQAQAKDPSSSSMNIFKEDAPQKRTLHSLHNQHTLRTANSHIHTHVNTHRSRPSPTTHMHPHARHANTLPHDARAHIT